MSPGPIPFWVTLQWVGPLFGKSGGSRPLCLCTALSLALYPLQVFLLTLQYLVSTMEGGHVCPTDYSLKALSEVWFTGIKNFSFIQLQRPPGKSRFSVSFLQLVKPSLHPFPLHRFLWICKGRICLCFYFECHINTESPFGILMK